MAGNFIRSYSGRNVSLSHPGADAIDIHDIARHLAHLPRFGGASHTIVNVASHSIHVARELARQKASPQARLWGLLHDAHEYATGDITQPMIDEIADRAGFDVVGNIKADLDRVIRNSIGVATTADDDRMIAAADRSVAMSEWVLWMPGPYPAEGVQRALIPISAMPPDRAEQTFLAMFRELTILCGPAPRHAPMAFDIHGR